MYNGKTKIEAKSFAAALAVWSALFMLILWVFAKMGLYVSAAEQMAKWHTLFNLSFAGLVGGALEAAVISYVGAYLFVFIYNLFI